MNPNLKSVVTPDSLAQAWLDAKRAEDEARTQRLAIEVALVAHAPSADEGTHKIELAAHRVTITHKLTRGVDTETLQAGWAALSEAQRRAFRWSADVDLKALRALQEFAQDDYQAVAPYITTKPAKPSVKVEVI